VLQKYDVCIVGDFGLKGLLFGLALANAGKSVVLYGKPSRSFEKIKQGEMPFKDEGTLELLAGVMYKKLFVSDLKEVITQSYFVVFCIEAASEDERGSASIFFKKYLGEIVPFLKSAQHCVVRIPCVAGLTELLKQSFLQYGKEARVSCCPDGTTSGKVMQDLYQRAQIIASCDGDDALQELKRLCALLTDEVIQTTVFKAESTQPLCQEHVSAKQLHQAQG